MDRSTPHEPQRRAQTKIVGIEGLTRTELNFELQRGARFVRYLYCFSFLIATIKQNTAIFFIRPHESASRRGLTQSVVPLVFGWWSIPWGPIYTLEALIVNLSGGKDVTAEVAATLGLDAATGPDQNQNSLG